jgi:hypothetical protein
MNHIKGIILHKLESGVKTEINPPEHDIDAAYERLEGAT